MNVRRAIERLAKSPYVRLETTELVVVQSVFFLYLVQIVYALSESRHLYGDGAWFLIRSLAENGVISLGNQFYHSRFLAHLVTQWPVLALSRAGVHDLGALSLVYGIALYICKPSSLILCYRFLKNKRLIIFPALALFAGTINSEVYIVTESHLSVALFWPLLFLIAYERPLRAATRLWFIGLSIPTLLCYETNVVFCAVLFLACTWRLWSREDGRADQSLMALVGIWYLAGVVFSVLAILHPLDPVQRNAFVEHGAILLRLAPPGVFASLVTVTLLVAILLGGGRSRLACWLACGIGAWSSATLVGSIWAHPEQTDFDLQMFARSASLVVSIGALLLWLLVSSVQERPPAAWRACIILVGTLATCQCMWSIMATSQWAKMVTLLRLELASRDGIVPYDTSLLARDTVGGLTVRRLHAVWPLLPMSIIFNGKPGISTLLVVDNYPFRPFDARDGRDLPDLSRIGLRYDAYLRALSSRAPDDLDLSPGRTDALVRNAASTRFWVDQVGPIPNRRMTRTTVGENVLIRGWAIDQPANSLAAGVELVIDKRPFKITYLLERPDVADALRNSTYRQCGFRAGFPARLLGRGRHVLTLRFIARNWQYYYETPDFVLDVE